MDNLKNKNEVIDGLKDGSISVEDLSVEYLDDKDVALIVVGQNAYSLSKISKRLRSDRDVVLEAARREGMSMRYAGFEHRSDVDIAIEAVKSSVWSFEYFNEDVLSNKMFLKSVREVFENNDDMQFCRDFLNKRY